MKRIIALFLSTFMIISFTACEQKVTVKDFSDGNYKRSETYPASFLTKYIKRKELTFHIANIIYEDETAPQLADTVLSDYERLCSFGADAARPVFVYVVVSTPTGMPVVSEASLFCTADAITNGNYRPYLLQATFDLQAYWQCNALTAFLFEARETDAALLSKTYADTNHLQLLSLFPTYFLTDFANSELINTAKETAYALTEYILLKYDAATYLKDGNNAIYRKEWLASLGISLDISSLYTAGACEVAKMAWSFSKDCALMLSTDKIVFYISPTEWLTSSDEVYRFMVTYFEGFASLLSRLREEGPDFYSVYQAGELPKPCVHLEDIEPPRVSHADENHAHVGEAGACWHEVLHTLIPTRTYSHWLSEGVVQMLELPICDTYYINDSLMNGRYNYLANDAAATSYSWADRTFREQVVQCYRQLTEWPTSSDEFDCFAFNKALGYARSLKPNLDITELTTITKSLIEYHKATKTGDISGFPGNELSYLESLVFTEYLVSQYGLDAIIAGVSDLEAYNRIVPDGFEAAYAAFINDLYEGLLWK